MSDFKKAIISYIGAHNNDIFNPSTNKDGLKDKWIALENKFLSAGIKLVTPDMIGNHNPIFTLYIDYPAEPLNGKTLAYLIQCETQQIHPLNKLITSQSFFKKCFSWDDSIVNGRDIVKHCFGNSMKIPELNGFKNRNIFCSMIAANKALPKPYEHDLYLERQKAIEWFQVNAADDFALYGADWNLPPRRPNLVNKFLVYFLKKLVPNINLNYFPSWKGMAKEKADVLKISRFTIAYENIGNQSGYITEKIFDAFSNGCVPVYWGAGNIEDYIPKKCFIDRRDFNSTEDLYAFLKKIDEDTYLTYQKNISSFISSEHSNLFKVDYFADKITSYILKDLNGI